MPPPGAVKRGEASRSRLNRFLGDTSLTGSRVRDRNRVMKTKLTGWDLLNNPRLNKGTAFPESERDTFSLHGLLPPHVGTLEEQRERRWKSLVEQPSALQKYVIMRNLQDSNETLFYSLIAHNIEATLPIVYTPTVGEGCERFSEIFRKPRGLFVSYPNLRRMDQIFSHRRYDAVRCIVVSDGERILGLGDQGAGGMGIPIGKMALYTALAGIRPEWCLPILLDVGTDNDSLLHDPLYIGWKNPRVRGTQYDEFVDVFVAAVKRRWPNVLLQWEDFAGGNAARFLNRYRDKLCTFNDDIQGTAAVAAGTLLSAINVTGIPLTEQRIAVVGFGGAGLGISNLIASVLQDAGLTRAEACSRFYAIDRHGLLVEGIEGLRPEQAEFVRKRTEVAGWTVGTTGTEGESWNRERPPLPPLPKGGRTEAPLPKGGIVGGEIGLIDVVRNAKPTVLIGVSGQPGAFGETAIRLMARDTPRPVIFPLSNPTSRCEASPQDLLEWTAGRALIGTGSPFAPVMCEGREMHVAQTNNSYIFPGLALGILSARARHVSDSMIKAAALALAELSPTRLDKHACLLPPLASIRVVSRDVARAVGMQAIKDGLATVDVAGLEHELAANVWEPVYEPYERE